MKTLFSIVGLLLLLAACSDEPPFVDPMPPTDPGTGNPGTDPRTYLIDTYDLGEYEADVYYPSDYDSTRTYPVLYYNDGGLFNDVFGILTSLDVDPFIMVGIIGTNERAERFLPYYDTEIGEYTPGAIEYTDFIVDELIPFVESRYKVRGSNRALFGISFGGIHATWAGIRYPDDFRFTAALSPSYQVADYALFDESVSHLVSMGVQVPRKFYFDRGTAEWRNLTPFINHLETAQLTYGNGIYYYEVIGAAHESEYWALRIQVPFLLFLEGNDSEEYKGFSLQSYCITNPVDGEGPVGRINAIASYDNGILFSVTTESELEVVQGSGTITLDGTYEVTSGNSMTIAVTYKGETKNVTVAACD